MSNVSYFTEEGLQKLKDELKHLRTVERPSISRQIGEARDKGDLLEMKISKLETLIGNARIVDESQLDTSKVLVLCKVKIRNVVNKAMMEYTLVSEKEADIKQKKISVDSPIGKGLLGKKVGEIAEVQVPSGLMKFEIIEISR